MFQSAWPLLLHIDICKLLQLLIIHEERICFKYIDVEWNIMEKKKQPQYFIQIKLLNDVWCTVLEIIILLIILQDSNILSATFPGSTQVAYILSLGVVEGYRRKGIGEFLGLKVD